MADVDTKTADPIDVHVGARVRTRRRWLGFSQTQLATALGITFQQVQKYERGANRVSASMLLKVARKLEVTVGYFFEGLEGAKGEATPDAELRLRAFMEDFRFQALAARLQDLPEAQRKAAFTAVLAVTTALAEVMELPRSRGLGHTSGSGCGQEPASPPQH
jgi:transcriptional regulator with XRE-family HTH domain